MKTLSKLIVFVSILTAMLWLTACSNNTRAGYSVYQGYYYPNYGYGYGRGLYNRPKGFGGGGATEPPDPRPKLPAHKAE